jgi:hypothetical protein
MNNNNSTQDVIKKADELLNDIKQATVDFTNKTNIMMADIKKKTNSAVKDFSKTEKELKKFEEDASNEIDKAIIEFVA